MKHKIVFNLTKMEEMDKYGFNEEEKELLRLIKCVNKGELDHMSKKSIDIKEAVELLEEINADEELSQMLYYLEKKRLDENTAMYYRKQSEKKLKQSLKKLKDSEIKLKDSENKLKDSETKLKDSENKLKDSENKLKNSENTINILIKSLYNAGKNIEEISNTTNLDIKYVANAINNNLI